ncbi:omptin family outer membrane protease, partial [Escherichia coli]
IGPDPRNFNQRVNLGRNDLLIRTFPNKKGDTSLYSRNLNISDHTKNGAGIESYNFMTTAGLKYYF